MPDNSGVRPHPQIALAFIITNVGAGTTPVDGLVASGAASGWKVPTGYVFRPWYVTAEYNDARTAGTSTVAITAAGVELPNGPTAVIDGTNTLIHSGTHVLADTVGSGVELSVSATGASTFAPATADAEVLVIGYLEQA